MAELLYQGHGSYRLVSDNGTVVYVDPFVGEGYGLEADLVLITHEHSDHNRTDIKAVSSMGIQSQGQPSISWRFRLITGITIKRNVWVI